MDIAYVVLAEGFEEVEALTVADLLRRAGVDTRLLSLDGESTVVGSHSIEVFADGDLGQLDPARCALLVLPGGKRGTENLEQSPALAALVQQLAAAGRPLAAICAAPRILGRLGLLQGRRACCYPGNEATLLGAEVVSDPVVTDGPFITSRGLGTAIPFGLALVSALCGPEQAEQLAENIVYPG